MTRFIFALLLMLPLTLSAQTFVSEGQTIAVEEILKREGIIWSVDFLPNKNIIFTERGGTMWILDPAAKGADRVKQVTGVPKVVEMGQGGLLEVRVHPDFDKTKFVYLTYSESTGSGGEATTAFGRGKLEGNSLVGFQKLFTAHEPSDEGIHFGSRIEFDRKGYVYFTVGDRNARHNSQKLRYHTGKILRLKEDGSVPSDNPFVKNKDAKPEIWSYGHRNPQGLAYDHKTDTLWEAEMGPRGGDEVNLIKPGLNYGWPVITYGREYWGPKIGEGTEKKGMEQPVVYWTPSISPSGMAIYRGSELAKWDGNLFLGCLSGTQLRRLVVENGKVVRQEELLKNMSTRFRSVRMGLDGALYLSTDDGRILRLVSGKK